MIYDGKPCHPSLDIGWDGNPYVAFADQNNDAVVITTRRPGTGWALPNTVAHSGTTPSLAYDHDDGMITIAYHDHGTRDLVVVDGGWAERGNRARARA